MTCSKPLGTGFGLECSRSVVLLRLELLDPVGRVLATEVFARECLFVFYKSAPR
jgi:hypothetical protein